MPIELRTTRSVSDDGLAAAGRSNFTVGGGGGGGGGSILDGLETTLMGIPPADTILIRHAPTTGLTVEAVLMDAETDPNEDFTILLEQISASSRSVQETVKVTLPEGQNRAFTDGIALGITGEDLFRVKTSTGSDYTNTLDTLTVNVEVG